MKRQPSRKYRAMQWVLCGALIIGAGCATQQKEKSKTAPMEAAKPAPVAAPAANEGTIKTDLVSLRKVAPGSVALGETFEYNLSYSALESLDSLIITDRLGEGVSFVRSEPSATPAEGRLSWELRDLDKGSGGSIKVWVKAEREGNVANCATVAAVPKVCVATYVGRAALALEKTGPTEALVGVPLTYVITIKNTGSLPARDVVLVDELPEGMISSLNSRKATLQVGTLAPGEAKTLSISAKGVEKGRFCNVVKATSANAGEATAEACTTFMQPGLKLTKEGPERQFLARLARYTIVVANTGDSSLTNVIVTDTAPAGTTISEAAGANVNGNQAVWNLGILGKGQEKKLTVSLGASAAGNYCNRATVVSAEGLSQSAEACTVWSGVGALLLEHADNPDPIQVGETTTYTVRVTNQGTADDTNIKLVMHFPDELDPVSASNGAIVEGKTVTFPAFARLAPKQSFDYSAVAKGVKAGDARVTVVRTSDGIPAPTSDQESTRVY